MCLRPMPRKTLAAYRKSRVENRHSRRLRIFISRRRAKTRFAPYLPRLAAALQSNVARSRFSPAEVMSRLTLAIIALALLLIGGTSPGAPAAGAKPANATEAGMRVYPSRYYIIHTDMD